MEELQALLATSVKKGLVQFNIMRYLEDQPSTPWSRSVLERVQPHHQSIGDLGSGLANIMTEIWKKTRNNVTVENIKAVLTSLWDKIIGFISVIPAGLSAFASMASATYKVVTDPWFYKRFFLAALYIALRYIGLSQVANILLGIYLAFEDNQWVKISGYLILSLGFCQAKLAMDEALLGPRSRIHHTGYIAREAPKGFFQADIPTEHSPASALATIGMMLGTLIFAIKVNDYLPADYDAFAKRMNAHAQVARGFTTISDSFDFFFKSIKETGSVFLGLDPSLTSATPADIQASANLLLKFSSSAKAKIHTSPQLVREIIDGYDEYLRLRIFYATNRALSPILDKMQIGWVNLNTLAQTYNTEPASCRIVPVVMAFRGESGVGKSSLMYHLATYVLAQTSAITPTMSDEAIKKKIKSCIYPRAAETVHWEGFKDQPVAMVDDGFQERDSVAKPCLDAMELIRMSNPFPMPLHMANLSAKGNTNFSSRVLIYTTNIKRLRFESIISNEAVQNRISMPYEVKIRAEYATETGKLKDEYKTGTINTDVYEFFKWNLDSGAIATTSISYDQLVKEMLRRMRENKSRADQYDIDLIANARVAMTTVEQTGEIEPLPEVRYNSEESESEEEDPEPRTGDLFPNFANPFSAYNRARGGYRGRGRGRRHYQMDPLPDLPRFAGNRPLRPNNPPPPLHEAGLGRVEFANRAYNIEEIRDQFGYEEDELETPALTDSWIHKYLPGFIFKPLGLARRQMQCNARAAFFIARDTVPPLYQHYLVAAREADIDTTNVPALMAFFEATPRLYHQIRDAHTTTIRSVEDALFAIDARAAQYAYLLEGAALALLLIGVVAAAYKINSALFAPDDTDPRWWKAVIVDVQYADREELEAALARCDTEYDEHGHILKNTFEVISNYFDWAILNDRAVLRKTDIDTTRESSIHHRVEETMVPTVVESGKSRVYKAVAKVESGKDRKHAPKTALEGTPQSWGNDNSHQISCVIRRNAVKLVICVDGVELPNRVIGLFAGNRDLLLNRHYLSLFDEIVQLRSDAQVTVSIRTVGSSTGVQYTIDELKKTIIPYKRGELDTDVILLRLADRKGQRYRDITPYLIQVDQIASLKSRQVVLSVPGTTNEWETKFGKILDINTTTLGSHVYGETIHADIGSIAGDCGGFYTLDDSLSARKVCGFHFAGYLGQRGALATILTVEDLSKIMNPQVEYNMETLDARIPEMLNGNCLYVGKVARGLTVPGKTKMMQTRIFDKVMVSSVEPARISYSEEKDGVLSKGLSKQFAEQPILNERTLDRAVFSYQEMLAQRPFTRKMHKLTYEEAVAGIPGDATIRGIDRTTSAGYPRCLETTSKGKSKWFGSGQEYEFGPDSDNLKSDIQDQIRKMERGSFVRYTFMNVLKDETRSVEKVKLGKTRVFSGSSIDFLIVFRMYFMSFLGLMMDSRIINESAVGIRAHSVEWHQLATRLKEVGNRMIAGDFSNFDGTLHSQILWKVYDIIEQYYQLSDDYIPKDSLVRRCLWENVVSSQNIVNNHIYQLNHSQPSGNPATAILNSMYNSIACRYVFYAAGYSKFNQHVRMIAYGDDNVLSVSPQVSFNQAEMSDQFLKIGMVYTDESKKGIADMRPIEEVSFLKRGFQMNGMSIYYAPLEIPSIMECFNWIHQTPREADVMIQNWQMANVELALHSEEIWNEWIPRVQKAIADGYGLVLPIKSRMQTLLTIRDSDLTIADLQWV